MSCRNTLLRFRDSSFALSLIGMSTCITPVSVSVPPEKKSWSTDWPEYNPVLANGDFRNKPWADPDIGTPGFKPFFNGIDGGIDRKSHSGVYLVSPDGYPLNPSGRTGICGRSKLGRWGPNHAADPVVTRWKRDSDSACISTNPKTRLPILSFVAIKRRDTGDWAIPGGMVDPGEKVSRTLRREFMEEALNGLELEEGTKKEKLAVIDKFFDSGTEVFRGQVVNDPRNTDNSWMETVVYHIHDETGDIVGNLDLKAGDDAAEVTWKDIDSNLSLYADHKDFIQKIVTRMNAHW